MFLKHFIIYPYDLAFEAAYIYIHTRTHTYTHLSLLPVQKNVFYIKIKRYFE